jgi:hypothetical protein
LQAPRKQSTNMGSGGSDPRVSLTGFNRRLAALWQDASHEKRDLRWSFAYCPKTMKVGVRFGNFCDSHMKVLEEWTEHDIVEEYGERSCPGGRWALIPEESTLHVWIFRPISALLTTRPRWTSQVAAATSFYQWTELGSNKPGHRRWRCQLKNGEVGLGSVVGESGEEMVWERFHEVSRKHVFLADTKTQLLVPCPPFVPTCYVRPLPRVIPPVKVEPPRRAVTSVVEWWG